MSMTVNDLISSLEETKAALPKWDLVVLVDGRYRTVDYVDTDFPHYLIIGVGD